MSSFDWKTFLSEWTRELLRREKQSGNQDIRPDVVESNWLGYPGAREWQIDAAENRLGAKLPSS
jgi:hypothetical protein